MPCDTGRRATRRFGSGGEFAPFLDELPDLRATARWITAQPWCDGRLGLVGFSRFGLVVRHHELGYRANAMVVWDVPDAEVRAAGSRLAALDFVVLPSRLVESVIALSIILVALNNIFGKVQEGSLWVILGLGLFHGLGFASVMGHLPFRMVDLVGVVLGFNLGVEIGQVAIVAVVFALLFWLRKSTIYQPFVLRGVSVVLILIAGWWFVERAFGL